jgi:hypothetical protein
MSELDDLRAEIAALITPAPDLRSAKGRWLAASIR